MIPLHTRGDIHEVNNYRGITLESCISKLYTCVLNKRLSDWSEKNDIISDAQFGFKKGYSTTDAIFSLHCLVEHIINNGNKLYCAFTDMKKCFDGVNRNALWYKLFILGIKGELHVLCALRAMYEWVCCIIRHCSSSNSYFIFICR